MKIIKDELFGQLEYQINFWRGNTTIQMFDMDFEILLSVDGNEDADFSIIQREAFLKLKSNMKKIMDEVEKQIYEYYRENFESEADKILPKTALKKLVKPTELMIRRVRNEKRRLGLLCNVTWSIEDGLGIKIEDEVVEEVGYQEIVL